MNISNVLQTRTSREIWLARLSNIIWLAMVAVCIALCMYLFTRVKYSGADSWLPMTRALDLLRSARPPELIYQTLFFTDHIKFQYPPSALLWIDLLRSIGIESFGGLNQINACLLIAMAFIFSAFTVRALGEFDVAGVRVPIGPIAFIIALRYYPNNLAFQIGQMQILLGLLFTIACFSILRDRQTWAGNMIGLAVTIKPQFAPLALLALFRKDWRFLTGLFFVTVVALGLSVFLYGWRAYPDYLTVLEFLSKHGEYQHLNQSINGVIVRWLYVGPSLDRDPNGLIPQSAFPPFIGLVYGSTVVSSMILLALPFIVRRKASDPISRLLEFCNASVFFTMASPIAWVHHYNILLPAYVVSLRAAFDRWEGTGRWIAIGFLALSFVATGYPIVAASEPTLPSMNVLQSHVLLGALLLQGIGLVELFKPIREQKSSKL